MADAPESLAELRVLEGPNLYFPRAAIKLTLDISGLAAVPEETARRFAQRIGLKNARPGKPDTGFRQRFALRAVERLVRAIAKESGSTRLAVRVRPTSDQHRIVVAFPWRHRNRAQVMGTAIAEVLDAIPGGEFESVVDAAAAQVAGADPGAVPHTITPKIPVVAVTGTNGKTTTSRMIAHMARADGRHVGWSSTDGIYVDGELVEAGDYSGPSGAGRVLAQPGVEFAVTETARGGILLKGIGVVRNDVSVVTNVTADHLGLHGIDTLEQLAEVKGVVPWITRKGGWAVLNGDDPRVLAMRTTTKAQPWVFSRDPDSPAIRTVLDEGGRATTVIDDWISVLLPNADPDPLVELVDVPMTLSGLSRFNVENALAAASAGARHRPAARPGDRGAPDLRARPRAQLGPAEHLLGPAHRRRRHGDHRQRPQRGQPRVPHRGDGRPPRPRAPACCSASAPSATAPTSSPRRSARSAPGSATSSRSGTRRSTSAAAPRASSRSCSAPAPPGSASPTCRRTRPRSTASPPSSARRSPAT